MKIEERQNPFLVSPIQAPTDGFTRSDRLTLEGNNKIEHSLAMIHYYIIEAGNKWTKELYELSYYLWMKYEEHENLGIVEPLSSLNKTSMKVFLSTFQNGSSIYSAAMKTCNPFQISSHAYYGCVKFFKLPILKYTRRPKCKLIERYIGVGYKDKGHLSQPHKDGSPSWKDLSSRMRATWQNKVDMTMSSKRVQVDWKTTKDVVIRPERGFGFLPKIRYRLVQLVDENNKPLGWVSLTDRCSKFSAQLEYNPVEEHHIDAISAKLSRKVYYGRNVFLFFE